MVEVLLTLLIIAVCGAIINLYFILNKRHTSNTATSDVTTSNTATSDVTTSNTATSDVTTSDINAQVLEIAGSKAPSNKTNTNEECNMNSEIAISQTANTSVVEKLLQNESVRKELIGLLERASETIPMTRQELKELDSFIKQLKLMPGAISCIVDNVRNTGKSTFGKMKNGVLGAIAGAKEGLNK